MSGRRPLHPRPQLADNCHHRKSPTAVRLGLSPPPVYRNRNQHRAITSEPTQHPPRYHPMGRWLHAMSYTQTHGWNETTNSHNNRPTHWHGGTNNQQRQKMCISGSRYIITFSGFWYTRGIIIGICDKATPFSRRHPELFWVEVNDL